MAQHVPNLLTTARLGLAVGLFATLGHSLWSASLLLLGLAAITDWLDGWAARRLQASSAFGRAYDPLVDKIMVLGAMVMLLDHPGSLVRSWMVVVMLSREFVVTALRGELERRGIAFGADWGGKVKTTLQFAYLAAACVAGANGLPSGWAMPTVAVLLWAMLAATVLSGVAYMIQGVPKLLR